jgi:hypothetical protein
MKASLKGIDNIDNKPLSAGQHLLAATFAGGLSLIALNPISVVKTRCCANQRRWIFLG